MAACDAMMEATADLHRRAERSGVVGALLAGGTTRRAYTLFLRNLLPAYEALERELDANARTRALIGLELSRVASIERDLVQLAGPSWDAAVPLLPHGRAYADGVAAAAAEGDGGRLIAHAYTRYLGDLGGGPILRRRVSSTLHLGEDALAFYDFPAIADLRAYAAAYRLRLDSAARSFSDEPDRFVDEAVRAFQMNIALSEAVASLGG